MAFEEAAYSLVYSIAWFIDHEHCFAKVIVRGVKSIEQFEGYLQKPSDSVRLNRQMAFEEAPYSQVYSIAGFINHQNCFSKVIVSVVKTIEQFEGYLQKPSDSVRLNRQMA